MSSRWLLPLLCLLLSACGHAPPRQTNPLAQWEPSPNFDERRPIVIVIHATLLTAVHEHPVATATVLLPVPPDAASDWLVGVMEGEQEAAA